MEGGRVAPYFKDLKAIFTNLTQQFESKYHDTLCFFFARYAKASQKYLRAFNRLLAICKAV